MDYEAPVFTYTPNPACSAPAAVPSPAPEDQVTTMTSPMIAIYDAFDAGGYVGTGANRRKAGASTPVEFRTVTWPRGYSPVRAPLMFVPFGGADLTSTDGDLIVASSPATIATPPATIATPPATVATPPATVATPQATIATSPATIVTSPATIATSPATIATSPATIAAGTSNATASAAGSSCIQTYAGVGGGVTGAKAGFTVPTVALPAAPPRTQDTAPRFVKKSALLLKLLCRMFQPKSTHGYAVSLRQRYDHCLRPIVRIRT